MLLDSCSLNVNMFYMTVVFDLVCFPYLDMHMICFTLAVTIVNSQSFPHCNNLCLSLLVAHILPFFFGFCLLVR